MNGTLLLKRFGQRAPALSLAATFALMATFSNTGNVAGNTDFSQSREDSTTALETARHAIPQVVAAVDAWFGGPANDATELATAMVAEPVPPQPAD